MVWQNGLVIGLVIWFGDMVWQNGLVIWFGKMVW